MPVAVAKSGKVVYAGKGLEAYGLLIIVKHDAHYLSAYAYNKSASVHKRATASSGVSRLPKWELKTAKQCCILK